MIPIANKMQTLLNAFKTDERDISAVIQAIKYLGGLVKEEGAQFKSALTFPSDSESQNEVQKQMAFMTSGDSLGKSILKAASWPQVALNRMAANGVSQEN